MKTAKKKTAKAVEAVVKPKMGAERARVGKSANRTKGQCKKPTGQSEDFLVEKDKHSLPSRSTKASHLAHLGNSTCFGETTKGLPTPENYPVETLHPSAKIKLQLFPIGDGTRIGLEKDGYHPYLELTLSARKKILSVLKHINGKWGGSSVALGQPMLFPYNISEDLASYRWTLNDSDISAGDVYASIGSPSVFRLRYGWFSETTSSGVPSTSIPLEDCLQPESMQKGCSTNKESRYDEGKQIDVSSEEFKPIIASGAMDVVVADKMSSNGLVEPKGNEVRMDVGIEQSSAMWDDSLTNISIGALLSEASLQGRFNNCDPKSNGSNAGLQPSQLISDSFDAFIAAHVNCSQGPRPPPQGSSSSILDAEDTRHAFPVQKFSSSGKDALALGGSTYSRMCSQDAGSKSFKYPNMTEVNVQPGLPQCLSCQESETDLLLCSRVYNDENSLGLSGIKWTDSLGPFDLGPSSSRKIISGDSLSISRIVS